MKRILLIAMLMTSVLVWGQTNPAPEVSTDETDLDLQEAHRPPNIAGDKDAKTARIRPARKPSSAPPAVQRKSSSTTTTSTITKPVTLPVQTSQPVLPQADAGRKTSSFFARQQQCEEPPHQYLRELSIFFGEGLSGIYYNMDAGGVSNMRTGVNFGAAYTYFVHDKVSISGGAGLGFYNTTAALPTLYSYTGPRYIMNDKDKAYTERLLAGYTEQQTAMMLNIPLMVTYLTPVKFYIKGGVQLSIPLRATYTGSNASILQGYQFMLPSGYLSGMIYDEFPAVDAKDRIQAGHFQMAQRITDYLDVKFSVLLSIEMGFRLQIFPRNYLYSGIFFDYGVNNFVVKNDKNFIKDEDNLRGFTTNSLLNSKNFESIRRIDDDRNVYSGTGENRQPTGKKQDAVPFVSSSHLMAVGIKLTYAFSIVPLAQTNSLGTGGAEPQALTPWQNISDKLDRLLAGNSGSSSRETRIERVEKETIKSGGGKTKKKTVTKKQRTKLMRTVGERLSGYTPRQTTLSPEQKAKLSQKANALRNMPEAKITIYGHTSDLGADAKSVGTKRAQAVKNYLVQKGVKSGNISVVSRGADTPLVPNINAENRKTNSRVEIVAK